MWENLTNVGNWMFTNATDLRMFAVWKLWKLRKNVKNVWNISHLWIMTYAAAYKALSPVPTWAGPSHTKLTPLQKYDYHHRRHYKNMIIIIVAITKIWLSSSPTLQKYDYHHHCCFKIIIVVVIWSALGPGWSSACWSLVDCHDSHG